MPEFAIEKDKLKKFFDVCSMEGTIQFRDKKGIKKPLFSSFYLIVGKDRLEVLTVDPYRRKTDAQFIKTEVLTSQEGTIPIMEQEAIMSCLKGRGISGLITLSNKDTIITLESEKDVYEIRQKGKVFLEELKEDVKTQVLTHLNNWKSWHRFDENGMLIMHYVAKNKAGEEVKQDVPYPMKIKVKKEELLKIVGDTINIMKDNKTRFVFKDGKFLAYKGEGNAKIKSTHELDYENLLQDEEFIEFDQEFYNVQSIIPNLFDDIELNVRNVKANGTTAIFMRSIDDKSNIEANIGLVSIVKGEEEKSS